MKNMTTATNIVEQLNEGATDFQFRKIDGTVRTARGTTKLDLIPADQRPSGEITNPETSAVVTFYDLNAKGWRSFRRDSVIA